MTVTVLFASRRSVYKHLDCDAYDIDRDARTYQGSGPVLAHPPCRAWSAYCRHQAKPREGEKELGPWAVDVLKNNGGILEHPAHSRLWDHCNLPGPGSSKGDLWCQQVYQSWWSAKQIKNTWLLFSKIERRDVDIPFRLHLRRGHRQIWNTQSKNQRAATSKEFAQWLLMTAARQQTHVGKPR